MPQFQDAQGRQWSIELDGLLLDDVLRETDIDLADLAAGGLAKIDEHAPSLVRVLCVLCGEQIKNQKLTPRDFAKAIRGECLTSAVQAVEVAVEDFFPKSTWSAVQSRLSEQKKFSQDWMGLRPLLRKLNEPDTPRSVQDAVMAALAEVMQGIDLQSLTAATSAGGPEGTPPTSAADSPGSAASAPAA